MEVISHRNSDYHLKVENGAHIYSQLICKFFVPNIITKRNWVTINCGKCLDNSIVFIHSNINTLKRYDFLKNYKNLILVCSQPSTCRIVKDLGKVIYLPLSVDTAYIKQFTCLNKDRECCYAGRRGKTNSAELKRFNIDFLQDLTHEELLYRMAKYRYVYAVGLTAIEAKVLGCNVLPYDTRFPDPTVWKIRDIRDMIPVLQTMLDAIDMV